jgi:hypothetical protein
MAPFSFEAPAKALMIEITRPSFLMAQSLALNQWRRRISAWLDFRMDLIVNIHARALAGVSLVFCQRIVLAIRKTAPNGTDVLIDRSPLCRVLGLWLPKNAMEAARPRHRHIGHLRDLFYRGWRTGWDSNPRSPCRLAAFRVRCHRPLDHLSAGGDKGGPGLWQAVLRRDRASRPGPARRRKRR